LVDLLTPPEDGYHLVHAVATTFTLDLTALLQIPLALAGTDLSKSKDPISILQAITKYSDKIDVFCQAGYVSAPAKHNDLLAFLEKIVHQVKAPSPGHLFHPKLWALRFANDRGDQDLFRIVCGSRNLTHDRSWDVAICLEGTRTNRRQAVNRPIYDLLMSLAGRVPAGVPTARKRAIKELAEGIRNVEWERPEGVVSHNDWLAFHVFGPGLPTSPNMSGYNRLVASPFINDAGLEIAWPDGEKKCVLISRAESFNALGKEWREWLELQDNLRVVNEAAAIPDSESEEAGLRWSLSGLHAKLYIVERDKEAHVFLGSANATSAAWGGNDELLIEIIGKIGTYGVDAALDDSSGFGFILIPHSLDDPIPEKPDDELRRTLENALRDLCSQTYTATVEASDESLALTVSSVESLRHSAALPPDAVLTFQLLTVNGNPHKAQFGERLNHRWQLAEVEEITPFLVISLASGSGASRVEVRAVALARLIGDPPDRLDRILASKFDNTEKFLRFILLLLQLAGSEGESRDGQGAGELGAYTMAQSGLLEAVLASLASSPGTIDDIDRIVKQLGSTDRGREIIPDGWADFWPSVVEARSQLRSGQ